MDDSSSRDGLRPDCRQSLLCSAPGRTDQRLARPVSRATGLIVTLTQVGYGAGLLFIVPLTDLVENRRLVLVMLAVCVLALLGADCRLAHRSSLPRHSCGLRLGRRADARSYAAHMASDAERGGSSATS